MESLKRIEFLEALLHVSTEKGRLKSASEIEKGLGSWQHIGADFSTSDILCAEKTNAYTHQQRKRIKI